MNETVFWYYDGREWIEKRGVVGRLLARRLGYLVAIAKVK